MKNHDNTKLEDLKKENTLLRQRLDILQAFVDFNPDLGFILDEQGYWVDILTSKHHQLYASAEHMVGKKLHDVLPKEVADGGLAAIRKTIETGQNQIFEYQLEIPEGLHWFEGRSSLLQLPENEKPLVVWVSRNISQRKLTELALQKNQAILQAAMDSFPFYFWVLDTDSTCILQNKALHKVMGNFIGKKPDELGMPEKIRTLWMIKSKEALQGKNVQYEHGIDYGSGSRDMLSILNPFYVNDVIGGITGISIDVTNLHHAQHLAARNQRIESLGVLAGGIAHDFNNILMALTGNLTMARLSIEPRNDATSYLEHAIDSVNQARKLTAQLLTFARDSIPQRIAVDLKKSLTEWSAFATSGRGTILRLEIEPCTKDVLADPAQLAQVINNLLQNAIEAISEHGEIVIHASNASPDRLPEKLLGKNQDYVQIDITDSGQGLDPHTIDRIFDPYFSTKQMSSGLGLTISHSIIEQHGGEILARASTRKGTCFSIYLPASDTLSSGKPHPPRTATPLSGEGYILVLDDDTTVSRVLEQYLTHLGYSPITTHRSHLAIEEYNEAWQAGTPFRCVILDLTIPGDNNGLHCLQQIRGIDPKAKAIVMSGYNRADLLHKYPDLEHEVTLHKPFGLAALSAALQETLGDS